jgi:glutamate racemase
MEKNLPTGQAGIDQLVLGCTHYIFLINRIKNIVGGKVNIIDPAHAVVRRVKQLLDENNLLPTENKKEPEILTSGSDVNKVKEFYKKI